MTKDEMIVITAMLGVIILGTIGLFRGFDGESYGFTVAALTGLGGYQLGKLTQKDPPQ